jgi:hypothetical protein
MLQLEEDETEYKPLEARTQKDLENAIKRFSDDDTSSRPDPMVRFMFFHAPNSRDALNTTHQMFTTAMSYNQVMSGFLDFVFPFGQQVDAQDFHFCGFRTETQLREPVAEPLSSIGRSGQFFQLCYNLKSVEFTKKASSWPWSIRHTATHMSFDVKYGRTNWIMMKGNKLIMRRMTELTQSSGRNGIRQIRNVVDAFAASLKVHSELCEWSREGWRWYIKFLEEQFHEGTNSAMLAELTKRPMTTANEQQLQANRSPTAPAQHVPRRISTMLKTAFTTKKSPEPEVTVPLEVLLSTSPHNKRFKDPAVAFPHLKKCQHIAEKCNEVLLVLKLNIQILTQLLEYYQNLRGRRDFPARLRSETEDDMLEFETKISSAVTDFKIQQSRAETLVQLLGDRKTLLLSKIEQSQMLTNQEWSEKAHISTRKMEVMTISMEAIAKKTERETILIRIITVVTLLFLPATYVSTLMSTDIIHYQNENGGTVRTFIPEALKFYFAITIPLTILTLICAYLFRWREHYKVKKRDEGIWENHV